MTSGGPDPGSNESHVPERAAAIRSLLIIDDQRLDRAIATYAITKVGFHAVGAGRLSVTQMIAIVATLQREFDELLPRLRVLPPLPARRHFLRLDRLRHR